MIRTIVLLIDFCPRGFDRAVTVVLWYDLQLETTRQTRVRALPWASLPQAAASERSPLSTTVNVGVATASAK